MDAERLEVRFFLNKVRGNVIKERQLDCWKKERKELSSIEACRTLLYPLFLLLLHGRE